MRRGAGKASCGAVCLYQIIYRWAGLISSGVVKVAVAMIRRASVGDETLHDVML